MSDFSLVTTWNEGVATRTGAGVSRPVAGAATAAYHLRIKQVHGAPMKVTMYAESAELAQKYAQARWPESKVEFV